MMLAGFGLGVYAGIWWAFIGGIVQFIEAIRAPQIVSMDIAIAVAKFLFSGMIGSVCGIVAIFPGFALMGWGEQ